nr:hypothetical protein [Acidimicrobiia bacterium]
MTVLFGFADAVGALLCEAPGAGPLAWLAVGSGLEEWDATAPPDDRGRRALTTEVARVRLRAGREVVFRPLLGVVEIVADLPPGVQGPLREVGVFAGARAGVPG